LAGCAQPSGPGRQLATGPGEGGIGGTGVRPDEEGGLGGTGVFGTITGFGSIHLNGLRVEIPAGVPVAGLQVGNTVAVVAVRDGDVLKAGGVAPVVPLAGPIDGLDPVHGQLSVMGTPVLLDQAAQPIDLRRLALGDRVEVSGIWRSGVVVATRVARVADGDARVAGLLTGAGIGQRIGGTAIDLACCTGVETGYATVRGAYVDGRLMAREIEAGTAALFGPSVGRLVVEAFLARNPDDPGYHLSGFGIPMDPASRVTLTVGQRSIFVGRLDEAFTIERSYPLPDEPAARRAVLDRLDPEALLE
jgi:hypothetical protein